MSSDTLAHPPKAVRRNRTPFGRNTRVVPSNIVLDRGPDPPRDLGSEPQFGHFGPLVVNLLYNKL